MSELPLSETLRIWAAVQPKQGDFHRDLRNAAALAKSYERGQVELVKLVKAQDKVLQAMRVGGHPGERVLTTLMDSRKKLKEWGVL